MFTIKEYKAAYTAAFGMLNKQKVLMDAAKDKSLSAADLVALKNWAKKQDRRNQA